MIVESNISEQKIYKDFSQEERLLAEVQEIIRDNTNLEIGWDNETLNKETVSEVERNVGTSIDTYSNYGISLERALNIQIANKPATSKD